MSSALSRERGPEDDRRIGALLRVAWQRVRERIYVGVSAEGYDDLNRAHLAMFRYEGLDRRRPTQLAEQMQITKQSINDLLRHLERRGYIQLRPDPGDNRARLVCLTARGRQLDAVVRAHARAAEQELAHMLGKRRFKQFHAALLEIAGLGDPFPGDGSRSRAPVVQTHPPRKPARRSPAMT